LEPWTKHRLLSFFVSTEVKEWFNPHTTAIEEGNINPLSIGDEEASPSMIRDPLLIRRPLFELGSERWCGFDWRKLETYLHTNIEPKQVAFNNGCSRQ